MMRLLWRQISPQDGHSLCFIQQSFHLILPQDYNPLSRNCGCIYLPSPPAQWSTHRNDSRNNKVYNQYHGLGCPDSFLWKRKKEGGGGGRQGDKHQRSLKNCHCSLWQHFPSVSFRYLCLYILDLLSSSFRTHSWLQTSFWVRVLLLLTPHHINSQALLHVWTSLN